MAFVSWKKRRNASIAFYTNTFILFFSILACSLVLGDSLTQKNTTLSPATNYTKSTQYNSSAVVTSHLNNSTSNNTFIKPFPQYINTSSSKSSCQHCQHHEQVPCAHCQGKLSKFEYEVKNKTDGLDKVRDELQNIDRRLGNFTNILGSINKHVVRLETVGAAIFGLRVITPLLKEFITKLVG